MKHIKLFEAFIKKVRFDIPPLFVIPKGVSRDRMYLVNVETGDGDITTFLADYPLIEEIYDVMTLKRIESAITAYSMMIRVESIDKSGDTEWQKSSRTGSENFMRKSMESGFAYDNITILATSPKFGPPVDVWIGSANEPGMVKTLKAMVKRSEEECKECGDISSCSIVPGDKEDSSGDDKTVYFDKDRASNMTDVVFDGNSTYDDFMDWYWENVGKSYYLEFPKIGTCVVFQHAANQYSISKITGGDLFSPAGDILYKYLIDGDFTTYDPVEEHGLTDEQVDEIMGTLVDREVPIRVINAIKKIFPNNIEQHTQGGVEYKQFIRYSVNSEKYYVQEHLDSAAKYNYYGKTREAYKKELEDSFNERKNKPSDFGNNPVKIPISLIDEVMRKLPRTQSEFNAMMDSTPRSELNKCAEIGILRDENSSSYVRGTARMNLYVDEIASSIKTRPFFPKSDPVKGKGTTDPGVFKGITPEMIRKATPFQVYCLCYDDINILK